MDRRYIERGQPSSALRFKKTPIVGSGGSLI